MGQFRRRQFLVVAAVALVTAGRARAQSLGHPVHVAILEEAVEGATASRWRGFRDRLRELGYVEGKNLEISSRFSNGVKARLPGLAQELIALKPDVIVTATTPATQAAMRATSSLPIVFAAAGAPVEAGLVGSLARPGGNVTGMSIMQAGTASKWIEILTEIVPGASKFAFLAPEGNRASVASFQILQRAAATRDSSVHFLDATGPRAIDRAFEVMVTEKFDAFMTSASPVILSHHKQLVDLAARHRLPGIYARDEYIAAGGLLSYGVDRIAHYRRVADYVHRILQGAKPADLPVERPTKFELAINMKTAAALGLTIPQSILLRADRVIE